MKKIFGILIFIILTSVIANAQPNVKKSENFVILFGKKYYVHKVQPGETIYAISKVYNVSQQEISLINKKEVKNLKAGSVLKIPVIADKTIVGNKPQFIYHKVERKQSLYSISKEYNVADTEILKHNPEAKYGLKKGMLLKIPINVDKTFVTEDENFIYHTVNQGETLFSLAQRYGIEIDMLIKYNPAIKNELKIGELLSIPKHLTAEYEPIKTDSTHNTIGEVEQLVVNKPDFISCKDFVYKDDMTFNVALMLPLYIEKNYNKSFRFADDPEKHSLYKNSEIFIEYYEGFLFAVNEMKKRGLNINLYVYDTENNEDIVEELTKKNELKSMDLIVGPIYSNNVKIISEFSRENQISMVSPLSRRDKILEYNPFLFQANPSFSVLTQASSQHFAKLYESNITVIHSGSNEEKELIKIYKKNLIRSFFYDNNIEEVVFKEVNYTTKGVKGIDHALSLGLHNIIVIPSSDEVFITNVVNQIMTLLKSKHYSITLFGLPSWERLKNIDIEFLQKLNLHYPASSCLDHDNSDVQLFITKFTEAFNTEPTKFSFQAYDIGMYFLSALKQYGKYFQFCISDVENELPTGIFLDLKFARVKENCGFENKGAFLLYYDDDLNLKKVTIK